MMRSRETVTISQDFQIAIPKKTCEIFGLKSGGKLELTTHDERIELKPVKQMKVFRGIAKGINTTFEREKDRI